MVDMWLIQVELMKLMCQLKATQVQLMDQVVDLVVMEDLAG